MSIKESDAKIQQFWKEHNIFEESVESRPKDKTFVFYDGPPFATGLPHYGHILGLTTKDLIPRFWTMKGYRVERRWGWDCHGLPIENIAEKELGIKEKKEIEAMGIAKFNEFCRSKVLFFADEWKKTVDRMGNWIEFDNSYKTMDNTYMESVWHIFKKLYDDGYVYKGKKVLMYCPHCETPLAKSEIAMDNSYKDVTENTAIAKFELVGEPNTFFLAWTTTPWTLIGNAALAVNGKLSYVKVKVDNEFLILAKDRLSELQGEHEIIDELPGSALCEKAYKPLYDLSSEKKGHYVIDGGDEVTSEDGTGIVHMAIYGEFDYEMIKKHDLPIIQHIDEHGLLCAGPQEWQGTWFKKVDKLVLADLEERNLLYAANKHTHPYPFCYRCDTPLFYNAVDSWFIDIQKAKKQLLERNKDINWYPDHLKEGRFQHIVETAPDWTISRNRYWATAMPVWECSACDHKKVFGSVTELQAAAKGDVPDDLDLHKHVVDDIVVSCEQCNADMHRIPEVFDCWFESGSMPYAAKHFPFENKEWFKNNFPCDFVTEYVGQVRAWFYYMHVIGVLLFDKAPFKNVSVHGNLLASDGSKMSKSKKNYTDPAELFDTYGADAVRFYLMSSPIRKAQDTNFSDDSVKEIYRSFNTLRNVKSFYELCRVKDSLTTKPTSEHILDRWILSKLDVLVRDTTNALERYDTITYCATIIEFLSELSTWYVRRSRDRFKSSDSQVKQHAIQTLAFVLHNTSKVIAPVAPHLAEEIHFSLKEDNHGMVTSVHLDSWPVFDVDEAHIQLHENMRLTRDVVSKALDKREEVKIPIRQALASATIVGAQLDKEYLELITDELNVKEVKLIKGEALSIELDTTITPELLREGIARDLIRKVNGLRKEQQLTVNDKVELYVASEDADIIQTLVDHKDDISTAVQATTIGDVLPDGVASKTVKINKVDITLGIKKV